MRTIIALLVALALCGSAKAQPYQPSYTAPQPYPPPVVTASSWAELYTAPVPAGRWVAYNRPLPIGQFLFGPIWVWQPFPQPQQQLPPPQR